MSDKVTMVPDNYFAGCAKVSGCINFDDNVARIGRNAFYNCFDITGPLILPVSLNCIGDSAFCGCLGLTGTLDIPAGVESIPEHAFEGCRGLTGLRFRTRRQLIIRSKAFLNCCGLKFIIFPSSAAPVIVSDAFKGCNNLVRVTLPRRLTSARDYAALRANKMQTSFDLKGCVPVRDKRGHIISYREKIVAAVGVCQDRPDFIFSEKCAPLRFSFPDDMEAIPDGAFACCDFLCGTVHFGISAAFVVWAVSNMRNRDNWELTTLRNLHNVLALILSFKAKPISRIGDHAFYKCTGLIIPASNAIQIGKDTFLGCPDLNGKV